MAAPFQTDLFGLAAKIESTYGTDATPSFSSNAIRLMSAPDGPSESYLAPNEREDEATGGLGQLAPTTPVGRLHEWSFEIVPLGAGSAYSSSNLPNIDPLLQTAFAQSLDTTSGSEKVTYTPSDSPETGVTLYTEVANKRYVTRGAVLQSLIISAEAGQHPTMQADLIGIADLPTEQALEAATYSTVAPPTFKGATSTINPGTDGGSSFSPVIRSYELDLGLDVAERGDGNAVEGHAGYRIVRRRPTINFVVEIEAHSTFAPHDMKSAATQIAFDLTNGGTQFERFDFDFDDVRITDISRNDDNGLQVFDVTAGLYSNSNEEVTIIFN